MKNRSIVATMAALVCCTIAVGVLAAPNDKPGSGNVPTGNVDDNVPNACQGVGQWSKVMCPATISFKETPSVSGWTGNLRNGTAGFAGATMGQGSTVTMTCSYTTDGTDRMSIYKTNPKACLASRKFSGFNCCN